MCKVIFKNRPEGSQILDMKTLFDKYPWEAYRHLKRNYIAMALMKQKFQSSSCKLLKIQV